MTKNGRLAAERIMVALDYACEEQAETLVKSLEGIPCYMKVGMQLFYSAGSAFVARLKDKGYNVFLDLKMHDIPNTVKGGAESITRLGVDMFNVHAAGGVRMMEAAREGVDKAVTGAGQGSKPLLIAVTQLTSTNQATLNDEIGIAGSVEDAVIRYAKLARLAGMAGVVASPHEVAGIKEACGTGFVTVTPGIRPAGADIGDQSRVMTPPEAFAQGTDYVVIGRPITAAPDPRAALEAIIASVETGC
ncbi:MULTISPECIES: orotidine-5'-phosphate decarboxylase [Paenibacillus]|uniref:Orotidine 5'-phosphate decarboxylase n=2 Tax=Paenibacillus validus TaxID=44253 RepID=A0A7X2ZCW0_9BACL|nr:MULTISPECIES: orotidine-5'-phosphate decarboxylase [Paenibacillus]MUG72628.1 orotidine-5'-phosphate decarboxylase [Paenibacillus validus]